MGIQYVLIFLPFFVTSNSMTVMATLGILSLNVFYIRKTDPAKLFEK